MKKYYLEQFNKPASVFKTLRSSSTTAAILAVLFILSGVERLAGEDISGYVPVVLGGLLFFNEVSVALAAHAKLKKNGTKTK